MRKRHLPWGFSYPFKFDKNLLKKLQCFSGTNCFGLFVLYKLITKVYFFFLVTYIRIYQRSEQSVGIECSAGSYLYINIYVNVYVLFQRNFCYVQTGYGIITIEQIQAGEEILIFYGI